jgi:hypothetical protein
MKKLNDNAIQVMGATLTIIAIAVTANYYMHLGWFGGRWDGVALNLIILIIVIFAVFVRARRGVEISRKGSRE